jgi:dolichol-phosphate mannosyltransferase
VVDDNSPDGTTRAVEELGLEGVHVICRRNRRGYGTAVRDGLLAALKLGADRVATMDADFSHNPRELGSVLEALDEGDLSIGSRYIGGVRVLNWAAKRLLLSLFANFYVRTILGLKANDCTSGFRAYRAELLKRMRLQTIQSNGYSFLVEMLWRARRRGARVAEVPIVFEERREGESKMSGAVIRESILRPWLLRFGRRV